MEAVNKKPSNLILGFPSRKFFSTVTWQIVICPNNSLPDEKFHHTFCVKVVDIALRDGDNIGLVFLAQFLKCGCSLRLLHLKNFVLLPLLIVCF